MIARHDWITTARIAAAVGVHRVTLQRWARSGLLPQPTAIARGRRGRSHFWPPHALAQALWVKARLDEFWTTDEIAGALARGDFRPPSDAVSTNVIPNAGESTRPGVRKKAPAIPREDLDVVARAVAAGRRQTQIAVEHGWHRQRVQRCCALLRTEVAAELGPEWLNGSERSVTIVAQQWLQLRARK